MSLSENWLDLDETWQRHGEYWGMSDPVKFSAILLLWLRRKD